MVCSYCEMIWRKLQSNYMGEGGLFHFLKMSLIRNKKMEVVISECYTV